MYIFLINGDMGVPFQARSHEAIYWYTFCRHGIYSSRHARAILMCLTLLNSFNHMKSFTMFIFSWLKFVKKRGTSIYLWRVYVMPSTLRIHCTFLLWHNWGRHIIYEDSRIIGIDSIDKPWWFGNSRRGMTLLRRETPAFAPQKWPGGTLYHYSLCELAQRQAVLLR